MIIYDFLDFSTKMSEILKQKIRVIRPRYFQRPYFFVRLTENDKAADDWGCLEIIIDGIISNNTETIIKTNITTPSNSILLKTNPWTIDTPTEYQIINRL